MYVKFCDLFGFVSLFFIVNKRERERERERERVIKELGLLFMNMSVLELFTKWFWRNLFEHDFF